MRTMPLPCWKRPGSDAFRAMPGAHRGAHCGVMCGNGGKLCGERFIYPIWTERSCAATRPRRRLPSVRTTSWHRASLLLCHSPVCGYRQKVTAGLRLRVPVCATRFYLGPAVPQAAGLNCFTPAGCEISTALQAADAAGCLHSFRPGREGRERFHYWSDPVHGMDGLFPGLRAFLETRRGDPRETPTGRREGLLPCSGENPGGLTGEIYYYTCIDRAEKLAPLYERFRERFTCIFSPELYTGAQWLEILPRGANKASAALRLKQLLNCSRLVCFGDAANDLPLFEAADECYAVENAGG
ncbi:MAG: HAD family hydrolase [Hydrogeniiclostridium mannosilyticum]